MRTLAELRRAAQETPSAWVVSEAVRHGLASPLVVTGLAPGARAWAIARTLAEQPDRRALVVVADERGAERLAEDLTVYLGAGVRRLPADEVLPYDVVLGDTDAVHTRLATLDALSHDPSVRVLVLSAGALSRRLPPPKQVDAQAIELVAGDRLDRDALARRLVEAGYKNVPLVEDPGTFAVRGDIIDVFPTGEEWPLRLELFDEDLESVRTFDPETQRTEARVDRARLTPAIEASFESARLREAAQAVRERAADLSIPTRSLRGLLDELESGQLTTGLDALLPAFFPEGLSSITEHLQGFELAFLEGHGEVESALFDLEARLSAEYEAARERGAVAFEPGDMFLPPAAALAQLEGFAEVRFAELALDDEADRTLTFRTEDTAALRAKVLDHEGAGGALTPVVKKLRSWQRDGWAVLLLATSAGEADRFRRLLEDRGLTPEYRADPPLLVPESLATGDRPVQLAVAPLSQGYVDPAGRVAVVTETDILGPRSRRSKASAGLSAEQRAARFSELAEQDLVVHVEHGIGRYLGLTHLEVRGVGGDFLLIEYAGGDRIYLPVDRLGLVQKYAGADAEKVRLDKLGGQSFVNRKRKVKEEVLKMAAELLELQAARKAHGGFAHPAPDADYRAFEAGFPHEETPDQARAIEEVLADMQDEVPMDRLVCGDVGFGKTEVAMRAAMLAVMSGKQVVVLVPTTVLAAQHERTFRDRFEGWPVLVEAVSRFRKPAETREILQRTREGRVDILIGTHRLLAADVSFKDLGLVVVDEEQRFGVKQKEALKKLRREVEVLTLTATPIPRTLHMGLSGLRDLSVIATPPRDRRSIRTFVARFDADTIREAIQRELARGGQVFYVHNRVQSIAAVERYLNDLMPEVRVVVAHGQMSEQQLARAMKTFIDRKADVLLSTTIIESGIDMPSVNTMIVNRADTFGLAQLYQLRGRVGRSRQRAWCYLMVPARRPITRDARKRLAVLQQLTELGSGYRLAAHDLEIRGAGNLLGPTQSGHVTAVGFDLYTQLLEEAVAELSGEAPVERFDPEVTLPVNAFIPETFVPDVHQRLDLYKRLAICTEVSALEDLRSEMIDRYGHLPEEAETHLELTRLKIRLRDLGIRALETGPKRLVLSLGHEPKVDTERLTERVLAGEPGLRLTPEHKLVVAVEAEGEGLIGAAHTVLDELTVGAAP